MNDLSSLTEKLIAFRNARNWHQYHSPANLACAISIEAGELLELYLWGRQPNTEKLKDELADLLIYILIICHELQFEPIHLISRKLKINEIKYPRDKCYGKANKYNEL